MTGYGEIKPHLLLNFDVDAQLRVMPSVCRIITAPSATERLMELLRCAVD
jgi:hypothetical protein